MHTSIDRRSDGSQFPAWLGVCAFLAIGAFFLWEEHRAHLLGVLPYLLLAACPIIHLFAHRSHGQHRHQHKNQGGVS